MPKGSQSSMESVNPSTALYMVHVTENGVTHDALRAQSLCRFLLTTTRLGRYYHTQMHKYVCVCVHTHTHTHTLYFER